MSLIDSCKRKLDDYVPDSDSSSSSTRMRTDVNNTDVNYEGNLSVGGAPSATCSAESSKSNSTLQFLVRLFSGMKTLVIRADVNDRVERVHDLIQLKARVPLNQQLLIYKSKQLYPEQTLGECCIENDAVLQLVGVLRSTPHVKAQQSANEIVSLSRRLSEWKSEDQAWDSEARLVISGVIKSKLSDYFNKLLRNDVDMAIRHLQVFCYSRAPTALAMLYMSPDNMIYGDKLIRDLIWFISFMRRDFFQQCVPILLEICKALRRMPYYRNDVIFNMCRSCLSNMVGCIEIERVSDGGGSSDLVSFKDMLPFVGEAAYKIIISMHGGIEPDRGMSPSLSLMSEILHLKNFLMPVKTFITEELFQGCRYTHTGPFIFMYKKEVLFILKTFTCLLKKMDDCLEELEKLMPTKSENLGCYEYVSILMELNNISKLFPTLARDFRTTLRKRKLCFCYLIIKYAMRGDDYGWISEHKEVTNFQCRRHLAMMSLPELSDEDDHLFLEMLIERSRLLEQSFEFIAHAEADTLRAGLFLEFKDEEATGPGVLREWFVLVCQAIFDPQNALFVACPNDRRRFFPNPASKVDPLHLEYFRFAGRVIALAFIHNVQVGIAFDRLLFLQLAGRNPSLEDVRDADPVLYSSCKRLLEMDPEIIDQDSLALTFVVETENLGSRNVVELCPDGKNIAVNSENREKYVAGLLRYRFVESVKDQVAQFAQGFDDIMNSNRLRKSFFRFLELEDLDGLLYGSEKALSVDDWKSHTDYNGYTETDPQISWFWETVRSMSARQRKVLLFFWTSLKNLPVEGFGGLTSRLYIYKVNETCNRLPSSQTCFYRWCFPPYQSLEVMQDRLRLITQEHVGCSFGTS